MGSLKQTHYVQEKYGDAGKSTIYYIDIRAIDRFEDFYQKVKATERVFVKSKVARITRTRTATRSATASTRGLQALCHCP